MDFNPLIPILLLVAILMVYTYKKDMYMKEPIGCLIKAYGFGLLAYPGYFLLMALFSPIFPEGDDAGMLQMLISILCITSVPMEGSKLIFLWLLLRKNDYFNEHVDGIIYATFVSLGFATLEGLLLLCMGEDASTNSFIYTARGILAAPVNWFLGILMGYYYSLAKFSKTKKKKYALLAFLVPTAVHTAYDLLTSIAFDLDPIFEGVIFVVFLFICYKAWMFGNQRINQMLELDKPYFEQEGEEEEK